MTLKIISIRVNESVYALIKKLAKEKHISRSAVVNDALEMYLSSLSTQDLTREEQQYLTTTLIYQHLNLGKEIFDNNKEKIIKQITENIKQTRTKR